MPYKIEPTKSVKGPFKVINEDTGEAVGEHASWEKATAHLKALYANVSDASKTGMRNSATDQAHVQALHDMTMKLHDEAVAAGAECACGAEIKGGAGSGNFGHAGRPGEVDGSADEEGGESGSTDSRGGRTPATEKNLSEGMDVIVTGKVEGQGKKLRVKEIGQGGSFVVTTGGSYHFSDLSIADMDDEEEDAEKHLDFSYVKSLGISLPDEQLTQQLAVKYVGKDQIRGYTFLWGDPKNTDIEADYFTKATNFWDDKMKGTRPLTWDHAQDKGFKASPLIGMINEFGDDEVGRWYVAKLDRSHRYRKAIDKLIEQRKLGTSSDSAPQYVRRVQMGKSSWLQEWPWFASALTDAPAEPRMIGNLEFFKSIGVSLQPDTQLNAWKHKKLQRQKFILTHKS